VIGAVATEYAREIVKILITSVSPQWSVLVMKSWKVYLSNLAETWRGF
jgi:hypothetical protein